MTNEQGTKDGPGMDRNPGGGKHFVLIADDCETDRLFLKEAIKRHAPLLEVVGEVGDGDEVIAYLWGYGKYADRGKHPMPDLLIMDVRMPRIPGIQVLEWLETQKFPSLKVAMLADSSSTIFRAKAVSLGLQHFYPKAADQNQLGEVVQKMQAELEQGKSGRFI